MSAPLARPEGDRPGFELRAVHRVDVTADVALVRVSGRFEGEARLSPYLVWMNGPAVVPMIPPLTSVDVTDDWSAEFPIATQRLDTPDSELLLMLPDGRMVDLPAPQPLPAARERPVDPAPSVAAPPESPASPAPPASLASPAPPESPVPTGKERRTGRAPGRWLATAVGLMVGGWTASYALQAATEGPSPAASSRLAVASPDRRDVVPASLTAEQALAATPKGASLVARGASRRILLYRSPRSTRAHAYLRHPGGLGAPSVFLVRAASRDRFKVALPIRPNGATAWIRAADVRVALVRYRVSVDGARHRLTVWRGDRVIQRSSIGVGRSLTPTPSGLYFITALLKQPDPGGIYGPYAFALSGHSTVLDEFAGGDGRIGIHGTNEPSGIGSDVSHGCIRVPNRVIRRLARLLPLGTPVHISH